MRQRINSRFANCLLAIGLSGLAPVAAQAQAANDKWQWELGIYGWFPAIGSYCQNWCMSVSVWRGVEEAARLG